MLCAPQKNFLFKGPRLRIFSKWFPNRVVDWIIERNWAALVANSDMQVSDPVNPLTVRMTGTDKAGTFVNFEEVSQEKKIGNTV